MSSFIVYCGTIIENDKRTTNTSIPQAIPPATNPIMLLCNVTECNEKAIKPCNCCDPGTVQYCSIHWRHESHKSHQLSEPCPKQAQDKAQAEAEEQQAAQEAASRKRKRPPLTIASMEEDCNNSQADDFDASDISKKLAYAMFKIVQSYTNNAKKIILDADLKATLNYSCYHESYSEIVHKIYKLEEFDTVIKELNVWEEKMIQTVDNNNQKQKKKRITEQERMQIVQAITDAIIEKYNLVVPC